MSTTAFGAACFALGALLVLNVTVPLFMFWDEIKERWSLPNLLLAA